MKKRLLALALTCCMVLVMLPISAAAESAYGNAPIYTGYVDLDYMADQVLKEIDTTGKSDRDTILAVYNWIIQNCKREGEWINNLVDFEQVMQALNGGYTDWVIEEVGAGRMAVRIDTYDLGIGETSGYDNTYTVCNRAGEMIQYRIGNCQHYASLLAVLLGHLGYDCRVIDGDYINSNGSLTMHKWNLVLLDGQYYWLDPRMDHANYERTGKLNHTFFLISDTSEWEKRHSWDHAYSNALMANASSIQAAYEAQLFGYGTTASQPVQTEPVPTQPTTGAWSNCSNWAKTYLEQAEALGLIPQPLYGADMTQPISRQEFAAVSVVLYEYMTGLPVNETTENPFTDTSDSYVLSAYAMGFVNGVGNGQFDPNGTLTREQACTMLGRTYVKASGVTDWVKGGLTFSDTGDISPWALDYVVLLVDLGAVNGMDDGSFQPKTNMTREQALKVVVSALAAF